MATVNKRLLRFGRARIMNLGPTPTIVIPEGLVVVDTTEKVIALGDGVTVGGTSINGKVWKFPTIGEANTSRLTSGDYVLVAEDKFWAVGDDGITEVELLTEEEHNQEIIDSTGWTLHEWEELAMFSGWDKYKTSTGAPRIRKDGEFVTLDAVLRKDRSSDWSPFRLPEWARPSKILYLLIEVDTGSSGSSPIVIYPDGYIYPRRIHSKSIKRVSFQLSYAIN